eukprot:756481-Hanusia_phi.AAC.9
MSTHPSSREFRFIPPSLTGNRVTGNTPGPESLKLALSLRQFESGPTVLSSNLSSYTKSTSVSTPFTSVST